MIGRMSEIAKRAVWRTLLMEKWWGARDECRLAGWRRDGKEEEVYLS
jgi:hypothetical protein